MNKKKVISIVNLITSMSLLTFVTIITHTEFILPPFLATAATKYPDPDWRRIRFFNIVFSYLISSVIAVLFIYFNLTGLVMALLASFVSFIMEVIINIEHPPSILACFLGVLEKVKFIYILHPVLSGVIIEESVNYILTKYVEPKLP
ncbi:HPP family protein [Sulfurisphaera ohwakuensis]|uniref:HPP family protein n=1 Tax=Sulfurisphaera ohwakuensis TaxID=69656 RepID=A0A650CKG9_SULOH|nr:HPP family protein [Sulfurisphaera ohwakuensis]MBB5253644.1 putative branched-subunit amino acid permease [Sulfurisphaera ohwakuensis]QGR18371.1 HPP family protein [Sulfurisphaera ohwakuensis]